MNLRRWGFILGAASVLCAGIWFGLSLRQEPVRPASSPSMAAATVPAPLAGLGASPSPAGSDPIEEAPAPVAHHLIDQFNSTQNGRALVMSLWQQPSAGGRFYASTLVDRCAYVRSTTSILEEAQPKAETTPESHTKVIAAFDHLRRRCADFTEDEYQKYSGRTLMRANDGRDPLMAAVVRLADARQSGITPARIEAAKAVVMAQDPLLLDHVGMGLALYGGPKGAYLYFDGERQPVSGDPPLAAAFYLLPCGLGLACDATDPALAVQCVQTSECYGNRFERVEKELTSGDAGRYQQALRLYRSMLAAVKNGEFWRFVPEN